MTSSRPRTLGTIQCSSNLPTAAQVDVLTVDDVDGSSLAAEVPVVLALLSVVTVM